MAASADDVALFDDPEPAPTASKASSADAALFEDAAAQSGPGSPPPRDVGYDARRQLRALSGPRHYTDDDLGIASPPEYGRDPVTGQTPGLTRRPGALQRGELAEDPTAQGVVASTVLGPFGRMVLPTATRVLGPVAAPVAVAAGEGAVASKAMGGTWSEGAKMGALFGLVPGAAAAGKLAKERNLGAAVPGVTGASERVTARMTDDIKRGETKAPARAANAIKGDSLTEVVAELPEVRKALATEARTNPGAARKTTRATLDRLGKENNADFNAMQEQHGGVPLSDVATRLESIEADLNKQGHGVAADAAGRVRADLVKRYGKEPDVIRRRLGLPDEAMLDANQLRAIRNDMGDLAFPPGAMIKPSNKRFALGKVYGAYNEAIEAVAAKTKGVDVPALKKRNRQLSTLIPVDEALAARAEAEAPGFIAGAKRTARNVPAQALRNLDYRMSELARPGAASVAPSAAPRGAAAAAASPSLRERESLIAAMRALSAEPAQ